MTWSISTFRHSRRKKDFTYQIKIKIRNTSSSFQRDFPIEFTNQGKRIKLSLTENEWRQLSKSNQKIIGVAEAKYREILLFLDKMNVKPSTKIILDLYRKDIYDLTKELELQKVKDLLSYELNEDEISKYSDDELIDISKSVNDLDIEQEGIMQEDEVGSVLLLAENHKRKKDELEKAKSIENNLERCDAQYQIIGFPDFSKIIDVFGYYWTLKKINGGRYLTKFDSKIVLRIAQFVFITGASNRIEDLDAEWLKSYFIYLREFGYLDTREIRNYTPLELYNFKNIIIEKKENCKPYQASSFEDQIKKFKRYFKVLKEETTYLDSIPKLNIDNFSFENLKRYDSDYSVNKTQKDHFVNVEELKLLNEYNSTDQNLNLTRDLFFIQVFSSGNRSIEKDIVMSKVINGITYFEIKHSKTNSINIGVPSKYLNKVLERHGGYLPAIKFNAKEYNENLKKIATELNLDRKIEHLVTKVNSSKTLYEYKPLYECISQYYSRHTLVNYLVDADTPDSDIIKITGHVDVRILDHYKRKTTVEDKLKIFEKADKNNNVI